MRTPTTKTTAKKNTLVVALCAVLMVIAGSTTILSLTAAAEAKDALWSARHTNATCGEIHLVLTADVREASEWLARNCEGGFEIHANDHYDPTA